MLKKIISFLTVCLCAIIPFTAFAAGDAIKLDVSRNKIIKPYWKAIAEFNNGFDVSNTGKANIESILYAYNVDRIKIDAELQQYKNGRWTTIKSWTSTSQDEHCFINESWYVLRGYSYRLFSTGKVYNNGKQVDQAKHISRTYSYK